MTRLPLFAITCFWLLAPALSLPRDKAEKGKDDAFVASMKFVKIPKGTFWMGWDSANKKSKQVMIERDFELAAYPVTQEQWTIVMGNNPSYFSRTGDGKDKVKAISDADLRRFPVEYVSRDDCLAFLEKLNAKQKGKGWIYRLPTEAEWEFACRNAATSKVDCEFDFYFDKPTNDLSFKQANFFGAGQGVGRPTKVGSYPPNKLGLYDMNGNVWQWCADLYENDPAAVFRGGAWGTTSENCRAAYRFRARPGDSNSNLGMRLARVPSGG